MKKKNIRSEYIKKLMEDKEALSTKLEETTKDTLKEILSESVNKELRNILNESDEDDFEEEEVVSEDETEVVEDETPVEDAEVEEVEGELEEPAETEVDTESGEEADGEDVWGEIESMKGEDGEYDLTGMDKDEVIKVLKVMTPEDGVRVIKNDNGSLTLTDDETDKEYIIDIDGCFGGDDSEIEIEVDEFDGIEESVNEDLGYTDNYQNKTAMTTPSNNEPANSKSTYSMDGGVPTGTSKPWAGKGSNAPYGEISEGEELDVEIECEGDDCQVDEAMTTQEGGAYNRGTGMVHTNTNSKAARGRNASAGGQKISSTSDNSYSTQFENIKRKANAIFKENKELKEVLAQLKGKLEESIVINASLGKIIQLVTENTTSKDEKVNIVQRFNNVKTIQESRELYKTISNELKSVHNNSKAVINESMDKQIAEGKNNNIIETSIYKSTDLSNTLDLMDRMMKL